MDHAPLLSTAVLFSVLLILHDFTPYSKHALHRKIPGRCIVQLTGLVHHQTWVPTLIL